MAVFYAPEYVGVQINASQALGALTFTKPPTQGDQLVRIIANVVTAATSNLQLRDGTGGNTYNLLQNNTPAGLYTIELGMLCQTAGGWFIATAAGVSAVVVGHSAGQ